MNETIAIKNTKATLHEDEEIEEEESESQVDWQSIRKPLGIIAGVFLAFFWLPIDSSRFTGAVIEALALAKWYAQEHVLLCLVPAFFIAGAISVFVSQAAVMKYLGAGAHKIMSYGVASVSGTILAVCSCTVLPLFAGIWKRGAGLGPAIAFLYSGPAVNVLAIVLTARILGPEIGLARAVGAVVFSVVIGLIMHLLFRKEEQAKAEAALHLPEPEVERPLWQNVVYFAVMVGVLVSATWGKPEETVGLWHAIYSLKWLSTGFFAMVLGVLLVKWFRVRAYKLVLVAAAVLALAFVFPRQPLIAFSAGIIALVVLTATTRGETESWFLSSWDFAKQIMPLLFAGVLVAGLLLGTARFGGPDSFPVDQWISGRQLPVGQSVCLGGRGFHVLCHPDGSADFARAFRGRHGQRTGPGLAAGRTGAQSAQHAGDPQCDGHEEDGGLCEPGGGDGHHQRDDLRALFFLNSKQFSCYVVL